jgi:DNA-binding response OmpR family regulator
MKILIIEDDPDIVEVVSLLLQMRWPDIEVVSTHLGEKGLEMVHDERPDVVILDLGLPDISGYDVLKRLRAFSSVSVVILTSRDDEADIIRGLEWGADDYISKPFRQLELVTRIKAVLRRSDGTSREAPPAEPDFIAGSLVVDYNNRLVRFEGNNVKLTPTEYLLLYHLTKDAGRILTAKTLLSRVWGEKYIDDKDLLKVHISNLRHKLGDDPASEEMIVNERGIGYRFVVPGK